MRSLNGFSVDEQAFGAKEDRLAVGAFDGEDAEFNGNAREVAFDASACAYNEVGCEFGHALGLEFGVGRGRNQEQESDGHLVCASGFLHGSFWETPVF